jgi:hypothetical protein
VSILIVEIVIILDFGDCLITTSPARDGSIRRRLEQYDDASRTASRTSESSFETRQGKVSTPRRYKSLHIQFLAVNTLPGVGSMIFLPMLAGREHTPSLRKGIANRLDVIRTN